MSNLMAVIPLFVTLITCVMDGYSPYSCELCRFFTSSDIFIEQKKDLD